MTASALEHSQTFSQLVIDQLRTDIVNGEFVPESKLGMRYLVDRYKVGLSPVREALHRLAGEGFVNTVGQRGFTVPPLSLSDLEDLTALRAMVEEAALVQAVTRGGDAWEVGIFSAFYRLEKEVERFAFNTADIGQIKRYDAIHRAFHASLFAGSSPRLASLQMNLFDQAFRYRKSLHQQHLPETHVVDEHRSLMNAVLSRDTARAVGAVLDHLQLTPAATRHLLPAGGGDHLTIAG